MHLVLEFPIQIPATPYFQQPCLESSRGYLKYYSPCPHLGHPYRIERQSSSLIRGILFLPLGTKFPVLLPSDSTIFNTTTYPTADLTSLTMEIIYPIYSYSQACKLEVGYPKSSLNASLPLICYRI